MTIEEELKAYILERYKSIREFARLAGLSHSTIDSILRRGIANSSVSNVIKICKRLNISADELGDGRITPLHTVKADPGFIEIVDILADIKSKLINNDGLTIDGKPADQESINTIVNAMNIGEAMIKKGS